MCVSLTKSKTKRGSLQTMNWNTLRIFCLRNCQLFLTMLNYTVLFLLYTICYVFKIKVFYLFAVQSQRNREGTGGSSQVCGAVFHGDSERRGARISQCEGSRHPDTEDLMAKGKHSTM